MFFSSIVKNFVLSHYSQGILNAILCQNPHYRTKMPREYMDIKIISHEFIIVNIFLNKLPLLDS